VIDLVIELADAHVLLELASVGAGLLVVYNVG